MTETTTAATWLYQTLANDVALMGMCPGGIWEDLAPEGTAYPFVVFHLEPGGDMVITGAQRLKTDIVATVKAVVDDSYQVIEPAAARIDVLLHKKSDGAVLSSVRSQPVRYIETDDQGRVFRHLGGQYDLEVQ